MKVLKFKLLKGGDEGIKIDAKEYLPSGNVKIVDDVSRTRKIMISDNLRAEIKKLKYFFLNLTGHWIGPYQKFYDKETYSLIDVQADAENAHILVKNLWNKTEITGAKATENEGFLITGTIETVEGKKMGFTTPWVTADDDIGFFYDAMDVISQIATGIAEYVTNMAISIEDAVKKAKGGE